MSNKPKPTGDSVNPKEACPHCGHEWGPHIFATADPRGGKGIWFCHVKECPCKGTWDAPQLERFNN